MKIPEIKIPENIKDKAQDTISKTKSAVESKIEKIESDLQSENMSPIEVAACKIVIGASSLTVKSKIIPPDKIKNLMIDTLGKMFGVRFKSESIREETIRKFDSEDIEDLGWKIANLFASNRNSEIGIGGIAISIEVTEKIDVMQIAQSFESQIEQMSNQIQSHESSTQTQSTSKKSTQKSESQPRFFERIINHAVNNIVGTIASIISIILLIIILPILIPMLATVASVASIVFGFVIMIIAAVIGFIFTHL